MKLYIVFTLMVLLLAGCAQKIVPGKATHNKNVVSAQAYEQQVIQPEKKKVLPPVTKEQMIVENVVDEPVAEEPVQKDADMLYSEPYKITLKTKKFAFSDTGFLNRYKDAINLQVFTMGKLVLNLKLSLTEDDICVDQLCNTKQGFNQTFLSGAYPDDLVANVLQSKPILRGKHLRKTTNGFMQKIMTDEYAIKYKIWPGNVYFKDTKNHIMIKLKKLPK